MNRQRITRKPVRHLITIGMALAASAPLAAPAAVSGYTVGINGMACPFCAYGIERKLSDLEGVDSLEIRIRDGEVDLSLTDGAVVTPEQIETAVAQAGFEVRSLGVRGEGEIQVLPDSGPRVAFGPGLHFEAEGFVGEPGEYAIDGHLVRIGTGWILRIQTAQATDP